MLVSQSAMEFSSFLGSFHSLPPPLLSAFFVVFLRIFLSFFAFFAAIVLAVDLSARIYTVRHTDLPEGRIKNQNQTGIYNYLIPLHFFLLHFRCCRRLFSNFLIIHFHGLQMLFLLYLKFYCSFVSLSCIVKVVLNLPAIAYCLHL